VKKKTSTPKKPKTISIVIPVYNEAENIPILLDHLKPVLEDLPHTFEIFFVDDGSSDGSWQVIQMLKQANRKIITGIRLSRNFGKEAALCAGLQYAKGDACVVMDADLQHPPAKIKDMIDLWLSGKYDIVNGKKRLRGEEGASSRILRSLFNRVLSRATGLDFVGASDFKLLDRKVIDTFLRLTERETFFRGLIEWIGFRKTHVLYDVEKRVGGTTKWSFFRLVALSFTAITSFSSLFLRAITIAGCVFFLFAVILGIQTLYNYFSGKAIGGFTTVILLILISTGMTMLSLGLVGEYLAKVFNEVKQRPRFIIEERI